MNVTSFENMSRGALMKFQNYFIETTFKRGQYAQIEGKPLTHLYLVLEGEFELSKKVEYVNDRPGGKTFDYKEFLPQTKHKYQTNQKNKRFM